MKKSLKLWTCMMAASFVFAAASQAATFTDQVTVSAIVQNALALDMAIVQNDGGVTSNVAAMNFGQLTGNANGGMNSTRFFTVYLTGRTQTLPFTITQTGTALAAGSAAIPAGACLVTPVYAAVDNGGQTQPSGSALGAKGSWVATNKAIYTSEPGPSAQRTIQAVYGLVGDPSTGAGNFVPGNQAAGNYSGTITYTLTA